MITVTTICTVRCSDNVIQKSIFENWPSKWKKKPLKCGVINQKISGWAILIRIQHAFLISLIISSTCVPKTIRSRKNLLSNGSRNFSSPTKTSCGCTSTGSKIKNENEIFFFIRNSHCSLQIVYLLLFQK